MNKKKKKKKEGKLYLLKPTIFLLNFFRHAFYFCFFDEFIEDRTTNI